MTWSPADFNRISERLQEAGEEAVALHALGRIRDAAEELTATTERQQRIIVRLAEMLGGLEDE